VTKTIFKEKYPVYSLTIAKDTTTFTNVDAIIEALKAKVDAHPVARFIAIFDHYAHTSALAEGSIAEEIKDAKNLIFCFGKELPTSKILAVRPRSIGVCELENAFAIDFMEAPNEQLQKTLQEWVTSLTS